MPGPRRAAIDIGTNSVKLLVAEVDGDTVRPLLERSEQTRLGRGFFETHRLQPDAIRQTAQVAAEFAAAASEWKPDSIGIIATSAARDALNPSELLEAVRHATGLAVRIISGEEEADWVFRGVTTDPALAHHPVLIVDVGGGSSEFILGHQSVQYSRHSFRLGTVRLLEHLQPADPPTAGDWEKCQAFLGRFLDQQIRPLLAPALRARSREPVRLVAAGGTSTVLAGIQLALTNFDRERLDGACLTREQVRQHRAHLWSLPLSERKKIIGLPPKRADVILMGSAIFEAVMEHLDFPGLRVSTRGLRYAAVRQ
ncbi:MAG: Ppx/GppA family phosphatase [Chloroflexi bacterium]|nr:Ppx/GppA family phosphatase [Chloroflexota bacterium]